MVWQKKPLVMACLLAAVAAGAAGELVLQEGTTVRLAAAQEAARNQRAIRCCEKCEVGEAT